MKLSGPALEAANKELAKEGLKFALRTSGDPALELAARERGGAHETVSCGLWAASSSAYKGWKSALAALFRGQDPTAVLFEQWAPARELKVLYSGHDTWDSMLQQGVQLLDAIGELDGEPCVLEWKTAFLDRRILT